MKLEDLRKLATGSVLFSLDRPIVPRLLTLVYLLGLAGIALWALNHLFAAFRFGFGNGLWGILEVIVFGLIGFVALRAVCEMVLIYYKANEPAAKEAMTPHPSASLIDDVAGAIEDLASEEDKAVAASAPAPAKSSAPARASSGKSSARSSASRSSGSASKSSASKSTGSKKSGTTAKRSTTTRRTARRTPKPKSSS